MNITGNHLDRVSTISINNYANKVYKSLTFNLFLTGLISLLIANSGIYSIIKPGLIIPIFLLTFFVNIAILLFLSFKINSIKYVTAKTLYYIFVFSQGITLSHISILYTANSIFITFLICSSIFISASIYGTITKKNLTSLGSFLMMGLIGIIIATIFNLFLKSGPFSAILNYIGVLIFTLFAVYDSKKIKQNALRYQNSEKEVIKKMSLLDSINMYLNFINLFLHLLRIFGEIKD